MGIEVILVEMTSLYCMKWKHSFKYVHFLPNKDFFLALSETLKIPFQGPYQMVAEQKLIISTLFNIKSS